MSSDILLLQRQDALQQEARAIVEGLALLGILSQAGIVKVHGSSVLGLMTWRDIDISVSSPQLSITRTYDVMLPLLTHPQVRQVRFLNEHGAFNPSGLARDERYFFMLMYDSGVNRVNGGANAIEGAEGIYSADDVKSDWKIDISFWLHDSVRAEPIHEMVEQKLTPETRLAILHIKDVWWKQPSYRQEVSSVDIYDAVLLHHVRTLDDFDSYLSERGMPVRV